MPIKYTARHKAPKKTHVCAVLMDGICLICGKEPETIEVRFWIGDYFIKRVKPGVMSITGPRGITLELGIGEIEEIWKAYV